MFYVYYVCTRSDVTRASHKTSKVKNFNKNSKGLGTTEKEKKQEETQTGR